MPLPERFLTALPDDVRAALEAEDRAQKRDAAVTLERAADALETFARSFSRMLDAFQQLGDEGQTALTNVVKSLRDNAQRLRG